MENPSPASAPHPCPLPLLPALLLVAAGCAADPPAFDLELAVNDEVPAVIDARWSVDGDVDGSRLELGLDGAFDRVVEGVEVDDGVFEAPLVGLRAATEYGVRAVATAGDERWTGEPVTLETEWLPAWFPTVDVEIEGPERQLDGFLVSAMLTEPSAAIVLDADGHYVWWHFPGDDLPMLAIHRARISLDGEWMVYLGVTTTTGVGTVPAYLVRVRLDGSESQFIPVTGGSHDFIERPDGTFVVIAYDPREMDDGLLLGDRLVEVTVDGDVRTTPFTTWDHAEFRPEDVPVGQAHWSNANHLVHDADAGELHLGVRNFDSIWTLDDETYELISRFGGEDSDYHEAGGNTAFTDWQHGFQLLPGGIVVFDNGTIDSYASRAVEFAIDEDEQLVEQVWEYTTDPPTYCFAMGDVHRFDGGNTLVTWTTAGVLEEVDPAGQPVWRATISMGAGVGFVTVAGKLGVYGGP